VSIVASLTVTDAAGISWIVQTCETNLGIICGCFQGIRPVLRQVFPDRFGSSGGPSNQNGYGHNTGPHGQSFPFQSLSGREHSTNKSGTKTDVYDAESPPAEADGKSHFTWVSKGGAPAKPAIAGPKKSITVSQSVTVDHAPANGTRPRDNDSEEWILHDRT
jgi:hypothetical protein